MVPEPPGGPPIQGAGRGEAVTAGCQERHTCDKLYRDVHTLSTKFPEKQIFNTLARGLPA